MAIDVKKLTHGDAIKRMDALRADIEDLGEEVNSLEAQLSEANSNIYHAQKEIDAILDVFPMLKFQNDLTWHLPHELRLNGYKLTSCAEKREPSTDSMSIKVASYIHITTILTDRHGDVVKEWQGSPCLGDLFDVAKELLTCP